jgi:hypothetical protein
METLLETFMETPMETKLDENTCGIPDRNIHENTWRRDGNSGGNKMIDSLSIRRGQGFSNAPSMHKKRICLRMDS